MKTIKDLINLFKENQSWIESTPLPGVADEHIDRMYEEYQGLGGKHSKKTYTKNFDIFLKITHYPYIRKELRKYASCPLEHAWKSKEEAFQCFIGYIEDVDEAIYYFYSADNTIGYPKHKRRNKYGV